MKKQLKKTFIRAPFKGTIDKVYAKEGELFFQEDQSNVDSYLDDMYIESNVPENYLNSISKGKKTIIEFPYINAKLESKIRQSGNFINPNNRTYKIEIDIPKTNLSIKPNLNARVKINDYSNENAILIDESFISIDGNNQKYVYKIKEEENVTRVEKKFVETGKNDGNRIEVTSGLNESDEIVSEGIRKIVNNSKVIVLKK